MPELSNEELAGLAFEAAGAASVPFMQDHPDYVMSTERISAGVALVLLDRGIDVVALPGYRSSIRTALPPRYRFRGWKSRSWPIRLRFALLLPVDSRWNAWVRDFTAWLERL